MNWQKIQEKAQSQQINPMLVLGEILQIVFLDAFYQDKLANHIYFQGGTSIRLLHNGWRYSEDLDFVSLRVNALSIDKLVHASFRRSQDTLVQFFGGKSFGLELKSKPEKSYLKTYWLHLTHVEQPQICRVKLEFAKFAVYQAQNFAVTRPDLALPITPLVVSESLSEILADKITAFAGRKYIKGRDIFDLWYLSAVLGVKTDHSLLPKKFGDYHIQNPFDEIKRKLSLLTAELVNAEMQRFLPEPYRTRLAADCYRNVIKTAHTILQDACQNQ